MSRHSKWSTIKRQKQTADKARGQIFTKLANAITIAVRESGGIIVPETNFKLRLAMEKAKFHNMPKENIDRAIERVVGKGGQATELLETIYEGFGPGSVAILSEGVTDNKKRTAQAVKNVFTNHGGMLAGAGSSNYLFKRVGEIQIDKNNYSYDDMLNLVLDANGEDLLEEGNDRFIILTKPQDLHSVKNFLEKKGLEILACELVYRPNTTIAITNEAKSRQLVGLLKALENLPEIHKVYTNALIPDLYL
jgi:YebC/PmpR family DNA-binding regulatory protein